MIGSAHTVAQGITKIPAYCNSLTSPHLVTPTQWKTCWDLGWSQPTTTAANAGSTVGHSVAPVLIVALIIGAVLFALTRRSSAPATGK